MLSKTPLLMISVAALAAGCNLDDGTKNACNLASDCLAGYACIDNVCVGGNGTPDAPNGPYFGTVEQMAPVSSGLAAENYESLVAATTVAGTLGCAVVGDLKASPGTGAVMYAKVHGDSGDARCPNGTFAIVNDPNLCKMTFPDSLREGCAIYKRWDASGTLIASQLATGGYVSITQVYVNDMEYRCDAQMSIRFPGNVTIGKTFSYSYNPLGPTSKFCKNG